MKVYVGGYKGKGAGSRFIKWFTNGSYSHVSLIFAFDGVHPIEIESIQGTGVHNQKLNASDESFDVYEVPCTRHQADEIYRTACELIGAKYDWGGIYGMLRRAKREDAKEWFCSELVAHCLESAGILLHRMEPWRQTPEFVCASLTLAKVDNKIKEYWKKL